MNFSASVVCWKYNGNETYRKSAALLPRPFAFIQMCVALEIKCGSLLCLLLLLRLRFTRVILFLFCINER